MQFPLVHFINLESRTDRLEKITKNLNDLGIEYERVDAVKERAAAGPGFSHCKCIDIAIEKDLDMILVCEDDVLFHSDTVERFKKCFEELPEDWDIFIGGASTLSQPKKYNDLIFKVGFFTGIHFVLYRKSSYQKVKTWENSKLRNLRRRRKINYTRKPHIDRFMGSKSLRGDLNIYCPKEFIVDTYEIWSNLRGNVKNDKQLFDKAKAIAKNA
jgi:GR25 family glycosyltransferase involved in LPS biosynthesis